MVFFFQWMVFISISKLCLSSPAFFFFAALHGLWSRIGLGSNMFLEKETAFPDFCILHLSSQLPKGLLSWPAGSLLDGKHICFWVNHLQPPITIMMNVFTYFATLWYLHKSVAWWFVKNMCNKQSGDMAAECLARKQQVQAVVYSTSLQALRCEGLSHSLHLFTHTKRSLTLPNSVSVHSHTYMHTLFLSRLSLDRAPPLRDYNSNAIFPLYVNVYYFSRYIRSPLLLQTFVPRPPSPFSYCSIHSTSAFT